MVNKKFKMKKIFSLFILITSIIHAQETEFTFTPEKGMTDYIVTPVESKTAPEIYKKIIEWIKITYKNPDKVILSTIENEYIRFEGFGENIFAHCGLYSKTYHDCKYQIEISIKDGKYKFDLVNVEIFFPASRTQQSFWTDNLNLYTKSSERDKIAYLYKKDGSLRNPTKVILENVIYFNTLNKSLSENINSTIKRSDGW